MKNLFCFCLFICFTSFLSAQQFDKDPTYYNKPIVVDQKPDIASRFFTGGNLGLQFGDVTFVDLSPLVGYKVTDKFELGVGITYQYINYNYLGLSASTNVYGGRVFARYYFFQNIFGHAEYEILSLEPIYQDPYTGYFYKDVRTNIGSPLVGGGYRQVMSDKLSMYIMLLWDLNNNTLGYTLYTNPVIRIGMNIGF